MQYLLIVLGHELKDTHFEFRPKVFWVFVLYLYSLYIPYSGELSAFKYSIATLSEFLKFLQLCYLNSNAKNGENKICSKCFIQRRTRSGLISLMIVPLPVDIQ